MSDRRGAFYLFPDGPRLFLVEAILASNGYDIIEKFKLHGAAEFSARSIDSVSKAISPLIMQSGRLI